MEPNPEILPNPKMPIRVISDKYAEHLGLLFSNPHCYRAAQANKPTPPKQKWKWSYANNG